MRRPLFLVSILSLILGAVALAPVRAAVRAPVIATWFELTPVSSPLTYGDAVDLTGQLLYVDPGDGQNHALAGVEIAFDVRYAGTLVWHAIGTTITADRWPAFDVGTTVLRNATYRVSFAGDATYGASSGSARVRVHRIVSASIAEPRTDVFVLVGKVRPGYVDRVVDLARKKCRTCLWRVCDSQRTNTRSRFRFLLDNPPTGVHYFRVRVAHSPRFITSYSDVVPLRWTH